MLSEAAQNKLKWFEEVGMKATFDDPQAYEGMVAAAGEKQQSGEPYQMPQGLPEDVSYEHVWTPADTLCIAVNPAEVDSDIVVVYYHGGGFVMDLDWVHLNLCAQLARNLKCRVVAPVYPCMPTATCDDTFAAALDAYRFVLDTYPGSRVVLMGDSAGGNLCITVAALAKEQSLPQPALLVPYSPFIDLMGKTEAACDCPVTDDPLISWYGSRKIAQQWGAPYEAASFPPDPFYANKENLAPQFILVGEREVLKAGIVEFAAQVEAAGSQVRLEVGEGLWHAFLLDSGSGIPEVDRYFDEVLEAIKNC